MKKKCRVFSTFIGWSDVMFIFDEATKFSDIKDNPQTHMLTKSDYIGTYDFDKKFISFFESKKIGNKLYFYRNSYRKENENQDFIVAEPQEKRQSKYNKHKDIEVKHGEVNAGDFDSLF